MVRGSFHVMVRDLGPWLPPFCVMTICYSTSRQRYGSLRASFLFLFLSPTPPPPLLLLLFWGRLCYIHLATLNLQCRLHELWICGHLLAVRTAAMHHRAWSLCLCFGDCLQLWCLSTCWLNTLTLELQRAGQRGGSLRAEGRDATSVIRISPPTPGITVIVLRNPHPPQWVTTLQQAFKLDREQLLSNAKTYKPGCRLLWRWPPNSQVDTVKKQNSGV